MAPMNEESRSVVVGVDGSDGSRRALEWAVDKADNFGAVRTVTAFRMGPFGDGFGSSVSVPTHIDIYRDDAEFRLKNALDTVAPSLMDTAVIMESSAGPALVHSSEDANLLVVGCRGRSAVMEMLLGSIGSYCVKHSKVPVAVVTKDAPTHGPLAKIAVGVDGSDHADHALRWALEHVDPGGTVIAVGVYNPIAYGMDGYVPAGALLGDQTRACVDEAVGKVSDFVRDGVTVEVDVRLGDPRIELRRVGEESDLLVVGSRGHQGVGFLLLGSVTSSILHHPTCVTIVVP